jgi:hypothetical protein
VKRVFLSCAALLLATATAACSTMRKYLPHQLFGSSTVKHVRHIAVLPLAYRAPDGTHTCDMCPDRLVMDVTSQQDALLVTSFFYEALLGHPRLQIIPFETVQAAAGETMQETVTRLAETEKVDAVLVGALLELRSRLGDPREPTQRGGASVYAALLDLPSGHAVWKRLYDRSPGRPGTAIRQYERLVLGEESKTMTAEEVAHEGVARMVKSLVKSLD